MAPLARRRAVAILISLLIVFTGVNPASALALPGLPWAGRPPSSDRSGPAKAIPASGPVGRLQEVAAPGAVQQLRNHLAGRHPRLTLKGPADNAVLTGQDWTLQLEVEDWPLTHDPDLGLGPHIAVQIDEQPPLRFSDVSDGPGAGSTLNATLPALSPGSHRLSAYAAYPWGEAVKSPGASIQWRLHQLQALQGTQPEQDAPWLVMVSPADLGENDPLLLDWLVWNAPLQNLRDGDGRWRLRVTANGDSFLVDRQEAIWLRQTGTSTPMGTVQMELLDGIGDPIAPVFNNQLRAVPARATPRPAWLKPRLSDGELARMLGEFDASAAPSSETSPSSPTERDPAFDTKGAASAEAQPDDAASVPTEEGTAEEGKTVEGQADEQTAGGDPEEASAISSSTTTTEASAETTLRPTTAAGSNQGETNTTTSSQPAPDPAPTTAAPLASQPTLNPAAQEERLAPTTSLGGSARELLHSDGSQR